MLINLRNALMAGKRLPYDAEVEYLESTGTQWIDTGVAVTDPSTVSVSVTKVSGNFNFGFVHANVAAGTWLGVRTSIHNKAYFKNYTTTVDVPNTWQQLRWDGSSGLYADGALVGAKSASVGTDAISSTSWPIFAMHEFNGGGVSQYSAGQISSVQIAVSGVLVRDFIPVRKGTVGYLYDRVSGKLFGNAGTGDFVLGPDVVPVEYIESHGTEYIDTGVLGNPPTTSDVSFRWIGTQTADSVLVGSRNYDITAQRYMLLMTNRNMNQQYGAGGSWAYGKSGSTTLKYAADTDYNVRTVFESGASSAFVNGVRNMTSTNALADTGITLCLFANNVISGGGHYIQSYAKARVYNCKLYAGNTLVRDYKAIRVGTDATSWEGAMMDVLTRRIYRNAGTGAFGYGNDLKYPIPAE